MNKSFRLLLFLWLILPVTRVLSQTNGELGNRFFSNWSVSLSGGPNIFFGDLKRYKFWPSTDLSNGRINEIRYAGAFSLNRQLSHIFTLRGQVLYGEIAGEKLHYKDGSPCNQYFEGNIFEYNINTTVNLSNLIGRYNPRRFFFVYATLGAGFSNWIVKTRDLVTHQQIGGNGSLSNWTTEIVIPAGLGAYFTIKDKVNIGLEWTDRVVNSDKLDNTPGGFPYDAYSLFALNVTYNFNKRSGIKLSPASPQMQIGPPPPQPVLAAEIAAEKQKEQAVYPNLPPPLPMKDTIHYNQPVLVPDTTRKEEFLVPDTSGQPPVIKGNSYRVQVFASRESTYSAEQIKNKFNLNYAVSKEFSGGWYRYTIGSFNVLSDAKKLMTQLHTTNQIPDAFIAKYVNGKRANPAPPNTIKQSKGKIPKPTHKN